MLATIPTTQKTKARDGLEFHSPWQMRSNFFSTPLFDVWVDLKRQFWSLRLQNWSETSRVSCFAWKSQNLKDAPKERVAFKHNTLQRREMLALTHLQKAALNRSLLIFASSENWAASSMKRNRNLIQPSSTPFIRKRYPASRGQYSQDSGSRNFLLLEVMVKQENPHSLLKNSGGGGEGGSCNFPTHFNRARASLQAELSHNPVPLTILRFTVPSHT